MIGKVSEVMRSGALGGVLRGYANHDLNTNLPLFALSCLTMAHDELCYVLSVTVSGSFGNFRKRIANFSSMYQGWRLSHDLTISVG